ncbi:hypothetical protein [Embleya sp. NBC_00896]|uniref:hypothetical protein n=1 Tax=Embleya sp. NBC_00896 TaxID=2975961 RepID=UPI002F90BBE5|nr:hypothetical protein OG928_46585 [Embleya sp. NBC_00896]
MTLRMRDLRERRIEAAFANSTSVADALGDVAVPGDIAAWLGRLHTLFGVPFRYLVPDEAMLPPESIRFFRLDDNWTRALLDGAFSLGRNLTSRTSGAGAHVDAAVSTALCASARAAAPTRRAGATEVAAPADSGTPIAWTGFLLRSRVVTEYPGLGVNVYGPSHESGSARLLPVHRLDRLGPNTDTLLCIAGGEAQRVEVHEAPELLHYGIDSYSSRPASPTPTATKNLRTFSRAADGVITIEGQVREVPIGEVFRTRSPRVVQFARLASLLAAANGAGMRTLDSAEMGFAMTEGVGTFSFEHGSTS